MRRTNQSYHLSCSSVDVETSVCVSFSIKKSVSDDDVDDNKAKHFD